ncbi:MAG: diaminopimelate epimerase [Gammaproteobacteria bacterium RIFCSPHIGHO2_12_FULL_41_15]|nr:MAG: diaminopimelate epimerase [Gammaproteobacteria bacterium RIFCSPHIGHO2_12_FULL_41_15]
MKFTKMQGLGNDFVVLDATQHNIQLTPETIQKIADRHFGIGCDQVLILESPQNDNTEFFYRIFNANGEEAEQCGNGARCIGRYIKDNQLSQSKQIPVQTRGGLLVLSPNGNETVTVELDLPFAAVNIKQLRLKTQNISFAQVDLGNPHAIVRLKNSPTMPITINASLAEQIASHACFPNGANVGFVQEMGNNRIYLTVYERGVGQTLACGSGACAAVVAGIMQGWLQNSVEVEQAGGNLTIHWSGPGQPVRMCGPAETVFTGELPL